MKSKILIGLISLFSFTTVLLLSSIFTLNQFAEAARPNFTPPPVGTIVVYKVAGLPPYNHGTQIRFAEVGSTGLINPPRILAQSQSLGLSLSQMSAVRRGGNIDIVYEIENVTPLNLNYPTVAFKHRSYDNFMRTFVEQDLPLPQGYILRDIWTTTDQNNNLHVIATGKTGVNQLSEIKLYAIDSSNALVSTSTIPLSNLADSISILKGAIDPSTGNIHIIANVYNVNNSFFCQRTIFVFDSITFNQVQTISFPVCGPTISNLQIGPQGDGAVILPDVGGNLIASYIDPITHQWSPQVSLPLPQLAGGGTLGTYLFPGSNSPTNAFTLATTEYSSTTPDIEFKLRLSHDTGRTFLNIPVSIFSNSSVPLPIYDEFLSARFKDRPSDVPFVLGKSTPELRIFHDPGFLGQITEYVVDQASGTQYFGDVSVVEF
ncbi:MAG: hypothetical protein AAB534_01525 [Patescibacteria group bacterium]